MSDTVDVLTCIDEGTHDPKPVDGADWHRQEHPDGTPIGDSEYLEARCGRCGYETLLGRPVGAG